MTDILSENALINELQKRVRRLVSPSAGTQGMD